MVITEDYGNNALSAKEEIKRFYRNGREEILEKILITEHEIEIFVNDVFISKVVCTPSDLAELTLGHLLSEGVIEGPEEIQMVCICDQGSKAKVYLQECIQSPGIVFTPKKKPMKHVKGISWNEEQIFLFMDAVSGSMPLRQATRSAHGCGMMIDGKVVFRCEDIGRHNALDKAVGYALRHEYDLKKALVYITGRVPYDMAAKAIQSGVPILISRRKPTKEALLLAKEYGLTLIGASGEDAIEIFCHSNM